jgi:hypothetical protein
VATDVAVEVGRRQVFATAVDWPGWSRSSRDEVGALWALADAGLRYRTVAVQAGVAFPVDIADRFVVVERLAGDAATDFGAPSKIAAADRRPLTVTGALRQAGLVAATWVVFDRVVAQAPETLRKGPRGEGRDRAAIVAHVREAEWSYARKLGLRLPAPVTDDVVAAQREAILDVLSQPSDGAALVGKGWPPRYAAARIAWHVLDHAWEVEDRTD